VADADLAICHLETPLTEGTPAGYPLFAAPAELADAIARTGWDACDTASNHTLDGGQEGVEETLRLLDAAGVAHTGSYASRRERGEPAILGVDGVRVALLAYTTDTNGLLLPEPHSVNVAERPEQVVADARRASEAGADAVIVNIHWGSEITPEYVSEPSEDQERFARKLARAPEVTAVVGQGPHVVQPIRFHGDTPVIYSEGNLLSNQGAAAGLAAESQDGLIALLDLTVDGEGARVTAVRYVPTWVRQPDYTILPIPEALAEGAADAATLEASYERTLGAVGRGPGVTPEPLR
jgi:poly-gamma-glutamate synthesis protein (capsule biosynthesis protein)